jgi:hypothetical protein
MEGGPEDVGGGGDLGPGMQARRLSSRFRGRAPGHGPGCSAARAGRDVLAYARLLLPAPPGSHNADILDAMTAFCRA